MSTGIIDQAMDYLADRVPWKVKSIVNGGSGVPLTPSEWNEVSISVFFPANSVFSVSYHLTKDAYNNRPNTGDPMRIISGGYNSASDNHHVVVKISDTGINVEAWYFRGTAQSLTTAKLVVSYR